jgi:prepilin-type N-terminal cleavage/methylation domain-containing protein
MKTSLLRRNQKGFTLIEIIAVLVILGILAAVAIPKYLDMRADAILKAAGGASSELNARERLTLAQWKLKGCDGPYPDPNAKASSCTGVVPATTVDGPSTDLGTDWPLSGTALGKTGGPITFQGKLVTFVRTTPTDVNNEPYSWKVDSVGALP